MNKISQITVSGHSQQPLLIRCWTYIEQGIEDIKLDLSKSKAVSSTILREVVSSNTDIKTLPDQLNEAGFMPQVSPVILNMFTGLRGKN